jgi:hypothetical protein
MRAKSARRQIHFGKEFSMLLLAWAGGIEPPNGGIKVRPYPLVFQAEFSCSVRLLAALAKFRRSERGTASLHRFAEDW